MAFIHRTQSEFLVVVYIFSQWRDLLWLWLELDWILTQLACSVNLVLNTIFIFIPSPNPQTCWICYILCSGSSSFTH